jgi:hypothetical protein
VLMAVNPPKPVPATVMRFMPGVFVIGEAAAFREGGKLSRPRAHFQEKTCDWWRVPPQACGWSDG